MCSLSLISFILCIVLMRISYSDAILCYQCADSTDNPEIANCMHKRHGLVKQRDHFQNGGLPLHRMSDLKNCSHYRNSDGEEQFNYCKIETIESYGTINGYIRDCSNGSNFASLNVTSFRYVTHDNQSTCGFSQTQGATICVRICIGDFCNGPNTGNHSMMPALVVFIMAFWGFTVPGELLNRNKL